MKYLVSSIYILYYLKCVNALIGGSTAYNTYAFMTSITINKGPVGNYFCGGTIISTEWIATAGQCVQEASLFTVIAGTKTYTLTSNTSEIYSTAEYILHPDYDYETIANDIGLIKLRMPLILHGNVQAIYYLGSDPITESTFGIVLGWGQSSDDRADFAESLEQVNLSIIENEECQITYGRFLKDGMFCAVGNYNEGLCYGDIGGPIVRPVTKSFMLIGIASFFSGEGCEAPHPSGFTDVSMYRTWIQQESGV